MRSAQNKHTHSVMRFFLVFTLLASFVFGFDVNSSLDSNDSNLTNLIQNKQTIFLTYEKAPSKVFVGQVFSVKAKAIITTQNFDEIKNRVLEKNSVEVLNKDAKWKWFNNNIFYKTFQMKALDKNASFPQMSFDLYKDGNLTESQDFPNLKLNVINLNANKYFSNVFADSLKVLKSKTTTFDSKNLITVLEIEAKNSNLKDFKLSWVLRDGIDSSVDNTPVYKIYYYAIIPRSTKNFVFTYFNTNTNSFIKKSIDIVINSDEISTQSNLNPKDNNFIIYKNVTYGFLAVILLIFFLKRRRIIYFLLFVILASLFFMDINPFSNIKISSNSKVYILPTRNSTIFYVTPRILYVQKIMKREDYIKILLPNGKIGWTKEENVIKN